MNNNIFRGSIRYSRGSIFVIFFMALVTNSFSLSLLFGQNNHQSLISPDTPPQETTISSTLHMYLVTLYGDSMQEIDHYRKTHKEGECITFILKTDKPVDMAPYLSQEEVEFLSDNGTTWQSEFMVVPDWGKYESFSEKDFAARFANKRIRVTGSLFCPMAGWQNATLVRMDFTKVELVE